MEENLLTNVQQMFKEDLILLVPQISDSTHLIRLMGELAQEKGYALPTFTDGAIRREEGYPTGLSTECMNLAVPHTDACHVIHQAVVVAKLGDPVAFQAMGMEEETIWVEYVFLLMLKNDGAQVPLLQKLMNMCSDVEATARLKAAQSAGEILQIIQDYYKMPRKADRMVERG